MDVMHGVGIDEMLERARADLDRVRPPELPGEVATGAVVVDIRPFEQRLRSGPLLGAIVVDRNVLEWRLDHTSPHRLPEATGPDVRWIIVCDEGYSSSLAAATLKQLGLTRVADLLGGFKAWAAWEAALQARRDAMPAPEQRRRFWRSDLVSEVPHPDESATA